LKDITYGTVTEIYALGNTSRTSYGIAVYAGAIGNGTATVIASVHDVTDEKERIDALVALCNRHRLSPEHLHDVIDDFLTYDMIEKSR
jgi:hypothetical protein